MPSRQIAAAIVGWLSRGALRCSAASVSIAR